VSWRSERVSVAIGSDDLWLGVKSQSNWGIAGSRRNLSEQRGYVCMVWGRALYVLRQYRQGNGRPCSLSNTYYGEVTEQTYGAKVVGRERNSADCVIRAMNMCVVSEGVYVLVELR